MAEQVKEILWTDKARLTFNQIIEYLIEEWGEKEVKKFVNRTMEMISRLKLHPEMCRPSSKRKNVRIAILSKQNQLIYHYKPEESRIIILLFWNPRQNPAKLKY